MDVSVKELEVSELGLAGDMISLSDPPRYWKVIVDNEIHCVCVSKEHAGAIANGLKKAKSLGDHLDLTLSQYELRVKDVVVARCSSNVIKRIAQIKRDELAVSGMNGPS